MVNSSSLQSVVIRFENVQVDKVSEPDQSGLRHVIFHDDGGEPISAVLIKTVTTALRSGQKLQSLRGLLHYPRTEEPEVIVELDQHLVLATSQLFGHVTLVEGYSLPDFQGCHALVLRQHADEPCRRVYLCIGRIVQVVSDRCRCNCS